METTKLETVDYEFEGRVYRLTCNMNAIAYVQDEYDGNLVQALDRIHGIKSTLAFLAGMMTDAADSQGITDENGLPLVFTRKQLGRKLTLAQTVRPMPERKNPKTSISRCRSPKNILAVKRYIHSTAM